MNVRETWVVYDRSGEPQGVASDELTAWSRSAQHFILGFTTREWKLVKLQAPSAGRADRRRDGGGVT